MVTVLEHYTVRNCGLHLDIKPEAVALHGPLYSGTIMLEIMPA